MNDLLDLIRECQSEEEIRELIDYFVGEFTKEARQLNNDDYIGINADVQCLVLIDLSDV